MMLLVNSQSTDYFPIKFQLVQVNNKLSYRSLNLTYSLSRKTEIRLQLIDINGNILQELFYDKQCAGKYSAEFNVNNLISGTYFFRIFANKYCETKEMLFRNWLKEIFLSLPPSIKVGAGFLIWFST